MNKSIGTSSTRNGTSAHDDHLRIIFNNTNEHGIYLLDHEGKVLRWNLSAAKLFGYSEDEILQKSHDLFFTKTDVAHGVPAKLLAKALKKGGVVAEGMRTRRDGTPFLVQSFITRVTMRGHTKPAFVVINHDVSEARQGALKREQAREEYIGIASHELKNPIAALALYAELLGNRLALDMDKQNLHMLRTMQDQTSRLVNLVDDLLLVSKIASGTLPLNKQPFNPTELVKKTLNLFNVQAKTHRIICEGHYDHAVVADKDRITQVLINLLTNAIKYSPSAHQVKVIIQKCEGKCRISVKDYGPGIKKEDRRAIFTKFFRVNDGTREGIAGSGLGLYIAREIMRRHRERLWVHSDAKGTTFHFTLSKA